MSKETTTCSQCGSDIPPGDTQCPVCGTWPSPAVAEETFEALHLDETPEPRQRLRVLSDVESRVNDDVAADYLPLPLVDDDTPVVSATETSSRLRPMLLLALGVSAVVWAVAEWRIATLEDWGVWEPIWYIAALVTLVLGAGVLILAWRTGKAHGWDAAVRSFLP